MDAAGRAVVITVPMFWVKTSLLVQCGSGSESAGRQETRPANKERQTEADRRRAERHEIKSSANRRENEVESLVRSREAAGRCCDTHTVTQT